MRWLFDGDPGFLLEPLGPDRTGLIQQETFTGLLAHPSVSSQPLKAGKWIEAPEKAIVRQKPAPGIR
jgi:hypothetical protein